MKRTMADGASRLLQGKKVLVAEDNFLVADNLSTLLKNSGCSVVGPAPGLEQALRLARWSTLDGAVVDVNLRGEYSFPVADLLRERRVPFLFIVWSEVPLIIPESLRFAPQLSKPLDSDLLAVATREFCRSRTGAVI
jgi:CheY-like chemotaxis protein